MTNSIAARDVNYGFAPSSTLQCLSLLMRGELRRPTKLHATLLRPLTAFTSPSKDQVALELREPAKDREH